MLGESEVLEWETNLLQFPPDLLTLTDQIDGLSLQRKYGSSFRNNLASNEEVKHMLECSAECLRTDCKRELIVEPFVPKPFLYLMVKVAVPLLLFSL